MGGSRERKGNGGKWCHYILIFKSVGALGLARVLSLVLRIWTFLLNFCALRIFMGKMQMLTRAQWCVLLKQLQGVRQAMCACDPRLAGSLLLSKNLQTADCHHSYHHCCVASPPLSKAKPAVAFAEDWTGTRLHWLLLWKIRENRGLSRYQFG